MTRTTRHALLFCLVFRAATPTQAAAQCPDGTPPPCARPGARPATAAAPENSVAVLYFENAGRDSTDAYLADGLTEEIITRLSGVERLTVRSRYVVRRYRGTAMDDPASVGRALNVTYLVSGSIRRSGGRLRVNAELIRAAGATQVWGRQFDQAEGDVFGIQEAVSREVATGIVGRLVPAEQQALATRPTRSAAAYDAMLRGNFYLARRDSVGLVRAIREYQAALSADPGYTDALSRTAVAYGLATGNGVNLGISRDSVAAIAVNVATEAVRRAPNSSDAWISMALARFAADPRGLAGMREADERAVALDPSSAEAHHQLSFALGLLGQDSAAVAQIRMALALEPARPITLTNMGQYELKQGRYAAARVWMDSALVVDPDFAGARGLRLLLLVREGAVEQARAEVARWRLMPALQRLGAVLEPLLALSPGDSAAVRAYRDAVIGERGPELALVTSTTLALMVLAHTGDREGALRLIERAQPRGAQLRNYLGIGLFDPIRSDPRFQRVVAESMP